MADTPLLELQSRYEDDSAEEERSREGNAGAMLTSPEAGQLFASEFAAPALTKHEANQLAMHGPPEGVQQPGVEQGRHGQAQQPGGSRRAGYRAAQEQLQGAEAEAQWEEEEEDDFDELEAAIEWEEMQEALAARGISANGTFLNGGVHRPNAHGGQLAAAALQPRNNNMQKLDNHFHGSSIRASNSVTAKSGPGLHVYDDPLDSLGGHAGRVSSSVANQVRTHGTREAAARARIGVDKSDRATVEQAIDPRTRMVLFKMLNRGLFQEIHGCISTGKEANVYHATGGADTCADLAIKVYKTSILVFKDRDRYVSGDYRFKTGYCRSNPRKMVKMWAEKELRNLARLKAAGLNVPAPIQLRMHVLVMEFIGEDGVAAPRLRDADLPPARLRQAYTEMVVAIRTLYQTCRLVHADLSEYNILYHKGQLWIIDVSQSVDLDHPKALDFLREDCKHINHYFRTKGVAVLTVRELFEFAVDPLITEDTLDAALDRLMEIATSRPIGEDPEATVADAVFEQAFIPKRMDEILHYERDHEVLQRAAEQGGSAEGVEGIYYQTLVGLNPGMAAVKQHPVASATIPGSGDDFAAVEKAKERNRAAVIGVRNASKQVVRSAKVVKDEEEEEQEEEGEAAGQQGPGERVAGGAQGNGQLHTTPGCSSRVDRSQGSEVAVALGMADQGKTSGSIGTQDRGEHSVGIDGLLGSSLSIREGPAADGISRAGVQGEEGSSDSGSGSDDEESEGEDGGGALGSSGTPMDKEARKAHKRAVKEANREKRKHKTPKHIKKAHKAGKKKK
ncbi:RIO1 family-domain-containing protein [Dunaliella salina]|uniref:non-specific serine/threonine protein kinase n=1 Tax=Dunaliella salina TaxID=3046 RepID=A0ABQ7GUW8_DUNSA|nr:RIO1 family-domain-containing protein [Dunaliella salina]|eukprot:KAF5838403.1 RIO1 family-domain-containing protein [Dunaliella salina]